MACIHNYIYIYFVVWLLDDMESPINKAPPSPHPKSEFVRLPPDGAEKIKIIDEL